MPWWSWQYCPFNPLSVMTQCSKLKLSQVVWCTCTCTSWYKELVRGLPTWPMLYLPFNHFNCPPPLPIWCWSTLYIYFDGHGDVDDETNECGDGGDRVLPGTDGVCLVTFIVRTSEKWQLCFGLWNVKQTEKNTRLGTWIKKYPANNTSHIFSSRIHFSTT